MTNEPSKVGAETLSPETIDYLLELLRLRSMGLTGPWKAKEKDMILELQRLADNGNGTSGTVVIPEVMPDEVAAIVDAAGGPEMHASASAIIDDRHPIASEGKDFEARVAEAEAEIRQWPAWKKNAANRVFLGEREQKTAKSKGQEAAGLQKELEAVAHKFDIAHDYMSEAEAALRRMAELASSETMSMPQKEGDLESSPGMTFHIMDEDGEFEGEPGMSLSYKDHAAALADAVKRNIQRKGLTSAMYSVFGVKMFESCPITIGGERWRVSTDTQ